MTDLSQLSAAERSRLDALTRIVTIVREETLKVWRVNTCIASTRVLIDVLAYFGSTARPAPVTVVVLNGAAVRYLDAHPGVPPAQWPEDAWSVGVTGTGVTTVETGQWDGHLVAVLEEGDEARWLLDATLDQFARPERGVLLEPVVLPLPQPWTGERQMWVSADGGALIYEGLASPGDWRSSPDWRKSSGAARNVVATVIRRVKESG